MERYVRNAADTGHMMETLYAKAAHCRSGTDPAPMVMFYAMAGESNTNMMGLELATGNTGEDATTLTDTSATYTGDAIGMFTVKRFDSLKVS